MKHRDDYLSEFELEFESDDAYSENAFEAGNDFPEEAEWEKDDEMEDSYETPDEGEFELESDDQEFETWQEDSGEHSRDREFEDRLYNALRSGTDNELEMEMEVRWVQHEMEQDYFFKSFKNLRRKYGPGLLNKIAGSTPWGMAVKAISKHGRGLIRKAINSNLLKTAAQFIPGAGPVISKGMDIAGQMMNSETPVQPVSRAEIRRAVQVGKQAYQNLAHGLVTMRDPKELPELGKNALQQAVRTHGGAYKNKKKTEIPIRPDSIVSVHRDKVIIWQS